jgi:hypothetical protein
MTDEPAELTIPGVQAKSLADRAAEEFARLGGPMMPQRVGDGFPPEFMEKYRADGGAREDAGANAWRAARDQALNEVHLMLRFLCRPRLTAIPHQLDPGFLMKLATAIEPDDRGLYMNVEHEGRRANRHILTLGAVKALAWYALANLPEPFVTPPPVVNSEHDQVVAAQARREAFALLEVLVYERLGMKTGMVPRFIELIYDVAARPYTWKRSVDENHG